MRQAPPRAAGRVGTQDAADRRTVVAVALLSSPCMRVVCLQTERSSQSLAVLQETRKTLAETEQVSRPLGLPVSLC